MQCRASWTQRLESAILSSATAIGSLADPILLRTGRMVRRAAGIVSQAPGIVSLMYPIASLSHPTTSRLRTIARLPQSLRPLSG
jgi:hypothetical protein